jgi:hypothetical protein
MRLFEVEIRRALHRRIVWVLVGIALAGIVAAGVGVFIDSADLDVALAEARGEVQAAVLRDWWLPGSADGVLGVAAFLLAMGGLIGGASVVGAEWRAGTVTTVLTWEPRRVRLHAARLGAAAVCAAAIAFVLQALFLAAFLPAVFAHGTTAGADGDWFLSLVAAMGRISLGTALAATIGASLAAIGRNTTAALVIGWGWLAIGEGIVRGLWPEVERFLIGENMALMLTWAQLEGADFTRPPIVALTTLAGIAAALVFLGAFRFARQDIAAS